MNGKPEALTKEKVNYPRSHDWCGPTQVIKHVHCGSCGKIFEIGKAKGKCWGLHPDYGTPNWCSKCTPAGIGYCRCEIAANE